MKKIISIRIAAITLIAIIGITSCSKSDEAGNENKNVNSFLKSFYNKKTILGNSLESKYKKESSVFSKSKEFGNVIVTEVFVGSEERARGYVITDKETSTFLYFVDVDRTDLKMTKVDIQADQTQVVENIDQLEKYYVTDQFDLIKVTQDLINENAEAGTLSRIRYSYGACRDGWRGVYQATYFIGINWTGWSAVLDDDGHPVTVACDKKYVRDLSAN